MKKTKYIVITLLMIIMIIFPLTVNASAAKSAIEGAASGAISGGSSSKGAFSKGTSSQINPNDYESSGPNSTDVKDMYRFGGSIAGVIQIVGTIVSAGAMIIIGIKYVMASADEKAEYRERMIPYFIGAVLLFGASNIVKLAYNMFS